MSEFDGPTPALSSDVEVTWDADALRAFVNAPDGAVGRLLLKAAYLVETDAIRRCPVDTGRLRASITHAMGTDPTGLFVDVGTDVEYAPYVEFGTIRKNRAQPFRRPALPGRVWAPITHAMGTDPTGLFADVGTDVEYAPDVEGVTIRNRAQPFLRPALHVLKGGIV